MYVSGVKIFEGIFQYTLFYQELVVPEAREGAWVSEGHLIYAHHDPRRALGGNWRRWGHREAGYNCIIAFLLSSAGAAAHESKIGISLKKRIMGRMSYKNGLSSRYDFIVICLEGSCVLNERVTDAVL